MPLCRPFCRQLEPRRASRARGTVARATAPPDLHRSPESGGGAKRSFLHLKAPGLQQLHTWSTSWYSGRAVQGRSALVHLSEHVQPQSPPMRENIDARSARLKTRRRWKPKNRARQLDSQAFATTITAGLGVRASAPRLLWREEQRGVRTHAQRVAMSQRKITRRPLTASGRNQLPGRFSGGRGHPGYAAPASGSTVPLPLGTYQPAPGHRSGLGRRGAHRHARRPERTVELTRNQPTSHEPPEGVRGAAQGLPEAPPRRFSCSCRKGAAS